MKNYNYMPLPAKIIGKKTIANDAILFRLKLAGKPLSFTPGQFVMLSVLGFGEIPVGIASSPDEKRYIEVAVRSAGSVTKKLCSLSVGETLGVNGPFGNGFPMGKIKGKEVVLVAGGIGLFPLRSLIQFFGNNKKATKSLTLLLGARCPENLMFADEYREWEKFAKVLKTVDTCKAGWAGSTGNISALYGKAKIKPGSVMIICGPPVMYRSVIAHFAGKRVADNDLYLDLERRMKCGIGKCQHCTCGKLYACTDGPIFSYADIKYNKEALS